MRGIAPIDCNNLERESEVIGNVPILRSELVGYLEYLKQTDFASYCEEAGVSKDQVIARSLSAYEAGNKLCDEKKFIEAIECFEKAIAEFPLFVEAHDNRAFALMDLNRLEEAAAGFANSLQIKPNGPVALFSLGECRFKLGQIDEAVRIFRECAERWPDQPHHRIYLAKAEALLPIQRVEVKKPRWRFW